MEVVVVVVVQTLLAYGVYLRNSDPLVGLHVR